MTFIPSYNTAPITYFAKRILDYIDLRQEDAFTWWSDNWGAEIDYTLTVFNRSSMHVARPSDYKDVHPHAIFAIPTSVTTESDNSDDERHTITIFARVGNVSFEGATDEAHAQQAAKIEVVGFYNAAITSILKKLRENIDYLTEDWPVASPPGPPPPALGLIYRQDTVQAATIGDGNELGAAAVITVELFVGANPFPFSE